jgi:transmembrane E3 ubiquitin-protein ligase
VSTATTKIEPVYYSNSLRFAGIFGLPHFSLSEDTFKASQTLLSSTLPITIDKQTSNYGYEVNPWSSEPEGASSGPFATPRCELILYLQQYQIHLPAWLQTNSKLSSDMVGIAEDELRHPTGAPLRLTSDMRMAMAAFSPDCGFAIESKGPPDYFVADGGHLAGPKKEIYVRSVRNVALCFGGILIFQIMLTSRQMREASTPSTRNRISFYSMAMITMGDGFAWITLSFASLVEDSTFFVILGAGFLAFVSLVFFGLRFLIDIWTVQATERYRQERQATANNSAPHQSSMDSTTELLRTQEQTSTEQPLLPVTRQIPVETGSMPIIVPSDQDIAAEEQEITPTLSQTPTHQTEFRKVYPRFCLLLLIIVVLCLWAESWPALLRAWFTDFLAFAYLSFWWPQIYRNVVRNCRKALQWNFVLGQSFLRLIPVTYVFAVENNIFFAKSDTNTLLFLAGWIWLQILALLSQELLGARFFIPDGWAPPAYDYHPVLYDDEESTLLSASTTDGAQMGGSSTTSRGAETKQKGKKIYDCTICAQDVEVIVVSTQSPNDSITGNLLGRRAYMVTPCRHIFHTHCLEGWMRYRLQCPNCREILPPL